MKTKKKVRYLIVMFVALSCVLFACSSGETTSPAEPSTPSQAESQSPSSKAEASSEPVAEKTPEEYVGEVDFWNWGNANNEVYINEFNKVYPNIKINNIAVASADYLQKLQTALLAGTDVTDIGYLENSWRGTAYQFDIWANLEEDPYNVDRNIIMEEGLSLCLNQKGELIAFDKNLSAAAFAYRTDVAEKYLGTSDPAEVGKKIATWDDFIALGKKIAQESGGKEFICPSLDEIYYLVFNKYEDAFVKDKTIDVGEICREVFDICGRVRDANIVDAAYQYSPAWYASYDKGNYLFYTTAMWSPTYNMAPNIKESVGKWRLTIPTGGTSRVGGTSITLNKESDVADLAWQFMKWWFLSEDAQNIYRDTGFFTTIKTPYETIDGYTSQVNPLFGEQDIGKFWIEEAVPQMPGRVYGVYDSIVNESILLAFNEFKVDNSITIDAAIEKAKTEIKNRTPELTVK